MSSDVAVLGVGMHPWGKWGRGFVEYGTVAARAALADAGVDWRDVTSVVGAVWLIESARAGDIRYWYRVGVVFDTTCVDDCNLIGHVATPTAAAFAASRLKK